MKDLLGGKGANLAEMVNMGLRVPPGFTITTKTCAEFFAAKGNFPDGLWEEVLEHLKGVEKATGKKFGDAKNPLLFSVRSGAPRSMPGMMDTVLNLGINDEVADWPIEAHEGREIRLRCLQALRNDVRRRRHGGGEEGVRQGPRSVEGEGGRQERPRAQCQGTQERRRGAEEALQEGCEEGVPRGPLRAAEARHRGGLQQLEHTTRHHLQEDREHPRRYGDRLQCADDGLR